MRALHLRIRNTDQTTSDMILDQLLVLTAQPNEYYALVDAESGELITDLVLKKKDQSLLIEVDGELVAQIDDFYLPGSQAVFDSGSDAGLISAKTAVQEDGTVVWQADAAELEALEQPAMLEERDLLAANNAPMLDEVQTSDVVEIADTKSAFASEDSAAESVDAPIASDNPPVDSVVAADSEVKALADIAEMPAPAEISAEVGMAPAVDVSEMPAEVTDTEGAFASEGVLAESVKAEMSVEDPVADSVTLANNDALLTVDAADNAAQALADAADETSMAPSAENSELSAEPAPLVAAAETNQAVNPQITDAVTPTSTPTDVAVDNVAAESGISASKVALGGVGLVALKQLAGNGGGGDAKTEDNVVSGQVVAGPVVEGNGLTVILRAASGDELGRAELDAQGQFTVNVGSYNGVVVAEVVDSSDAPDYLDEVSGEAKDLNAALFSVAVVSGGSTTLSINPLTTVAYHKLKPADEAQPIMAEQVVKVNLQVAQTFGLTELHQPVVATNQSEFNHEDGLSDSESYGEVLALLSGMDVENGGNTQQTIDRLALGLSIEDEKVQLSAEVQQSLVAAEQESGVTAKITLPKFTSATELALDENSEVSQAIHQVVASDSSTLSYALKAGDDASQFTIHAENGELTLKNSPDFERQASYQITVVATNADGNSSEQQIQVAVNNLDEAKPAFTSADLISVTENSPLEQVIHQLQADDSGDISSGALSYQLKEAGDYQQVTLNAETGELTLNQIADFEAKALYELTAVVGDPAGNQSEQRLFIQVQNLDDSAPQFAQTEQVIELAENNDITQPVLVVQATDPGDASDGSVSYSLKPGQDAQAFGIDAATGEIRLLAAADFEQRAQYQLTVIASDAAGNQSEQAVTIKIQNLDEVAPVFEQAEQVIELPENNDITQPVFAAKAVDQGDGSDGSVSYSLKAGQDAQAFGIDAATGEIRLLAAADFEQRAQYQLTVIASDAVGNQSEQVVTIKIQNLDEVAPVFTSEDVISVAENTPLEQVIHQLQADDSLDIASGALSYHLKEQGDYQQFMLNAKSGELTLTTAANFEEKASYELTVVVSDAAGNQREQRLFVQVQNQDEVAPSFEQSEQQIILPENNDITQPVFVAKALDQGDSSDGNVSYSLKVGQDANAFSIDATNGAVHLLAAADFEQRKDYQITIIATDATGNQSEQAVTIKVHNLDEVAPIFAQESVTTTIRENSGHSQIIYRAQTRDSGDITQGQTNYQLKDGGDSAWLHIDPQTGEVRLLANPDYETKAEYQFTVIATDAAGNSSEQIVSLNVVNRDDTAAIFTSADTITLDENSGAEQIIYQATVDDSTDLQRGEIRYSLLNQTMYGEPDFTIDSETGEVTLTRNLDYEVDNGISFEVMATDGSGNQRVQTVTLELNNLPPEPNLATQPIMLDVPSGTDGGGYSAPQMAHLKNGGLVSVWSAKGSEGDYNIYVQRFDAQGAKLAAAIELSASSSSYYGDRDPQIVSLDNDGGFVVAWMANSGNIYLQKFDADGAKVNLDAPKSIYNYGRNYGLQIAAVGSQEKYAVTWFSSDNDGNGYDDSVYVQLFNTDGSLSGSQVKLEAPGVLNRDDDNPQIVGISGSDEYAVVWQGQTDYLTSVVFMQLFAADGTQKGEVQSFDSGYNWDSGPKILATSNGYVLSWTGAGSNSYASSIYLQKLNADFSNLGEVIKLDAMTDLNSRDQNSSVVEANDGGLYVAWQGGASYNNSNNQIYVQKIDGDGGLEGKPIVLGSNTYSAQLLMLEDKLVVAWIQDRGWNESVYIQILNLDGSPASEVKVLNNIEVQGDLELSLSGNGEGFAIGWAEGQSTGQGGTFIQFFNADGSVNTANPINHDATVIGTTSEQGEIYLVHDSIQVAQLSDIQEAADNLWNVVDAESLLTIQLPLQGLAAGKYHTYAVDQAGNLSLQSANTLTIEADFEAPTVRLAIPELSVKGEGVQNVTPVIQAVGSQGDYVIAWSGSDKLPADKSIYLQKFNHDGTQATEQIKIEAPGIMTGNDESPALTALGADGHFAVVWSGQDAENGDYSIFVQLFDIAGNPRGDVVALEALGVTDRSDMNPVVTSLGNGDFLVGWQGIDNTNADSNYYDRDNSIFIQRFNRDGVLQGETVQLEQPEVIDQDDENVDIVAVGNQGNYVVSWETDTNYSPRVITQLFDAQNNKIGSASEFLVSPNYYYYSGYIDPTGYALEDTGKYAVIWQGQNQNDTEIFLQHFNADGTKSGTELKIGDAYRYQRASIQTVRISEQGDWVVGWNDQDSIVLQRMNSAGEIQGGQIVLNAEGVRSYYDDTSLQLISLPTGGFVASWRGETGRYYGDTAVYVQQFSSEGVAVGDQVRLPDDAYRVSGTPQIEAIGADGEYVVSWSDGGNKIRVQHFNADGSLNGDVPLTHDVMVSLQSSEPGQVFLVHESVSVSVLTDIQSAADSLWQRVDVAAANTETRVALTGLQAGIYHAYSADNAGNLSVVSDNTIRITEDNKLPEVQLQYVANALESLPNTGWVRSSSNNEWMFYGEDKSKLTIIDSNLDTLSNADYAERILPIGNEGEYITIGIKSLAQEGKITPNLVVQHFGVDNLPQGEPTILELPEGSNSSLSEVILQENNQQFAIFWQVTDADTHIQLYMQQFDFSADPMGEMKSLSIENVDANLVAKVDGNGYLASWREYDYQASKFTTHLYLQSVSTDGIVSEKIEMLSGTEQQINGYKFEPLPAIDGYLLSWIEYSFSDYQNTHYAQRVDVNGGLVGDKILLEDGIPYDYYSSYQNNVQTVTLGDSGNYLLTWHNGQTNQLHVRKYAASNELVAEFMLPAGAIYDVLPLGDNGEFVVTWQQKDTEGDQSIYLQKFDVSALPISEKIKLESRGSVTSDESRPMLLPLNDSGDFAVIWTGWGNQVYLQKFNSDGAILELDKALTVNQSVNVGSTQYGQVYLVHKDIQVNSLDDITSAEGDLWNYADLSAKSVSLPLSLPSSFFGLNQSVISNKDAGLSLGGLRDGDYLAYAVDSAGNVSAASSHSIEVASAPVFDYLPPIYLAADTSAGQVVSQFEAHDNDEHLGAIKYSLKPTGDFADFMIDKTSGELTLVSAPDYLSKPDYEITVVASDINGHSSELVQRIELQPVDEVAPLVNIAMPESYSVGTETLGVDRTTPPQLLNLKGGEGRYVLAWSGTDQQGDFSIFVQSFNADGSQTGEPVILESNTVTDGGDVLPQLVQLANGDYVVSWSGQDSEGDQSIYLQRFALSGEVQGEQMQLEADGITDQADTTPQIAALGETGDYVLAWLGSNAQGVLTAYWQVVHADGSQGEQVSVAVDADQPQTQLQLATSATGDELALAWVADDSEGNQRILLQRFNADGSQVSEAQWFGNPHLDSTTPVLESLPEGGYVLTWSGQDQQGDNSIFVQQITADGRLLAQVMLEGSVATAQDLQPSLDLVADDYVVGWLGADAIGVYHVYSQRFDSDGLLLGETQQTGSSMLPVHESQPQVAALGDDGSYAMTWLVHHPALGKQIWVQRFYADGSAASSEAVLVTMPEYHAGWPLNSSNDWSPQISAVGDEGAFVVSWSGYAGEGDYQIFSQYFDDQGVPLYSTTALTTEDSVSLQSSEAGALYLVHNSVVVETVNDIIYADENLWAGANALSKQVVDIELTGLNDGIYSAYAVDETGNLSQAASSWVTLGEVAAEPAVANIVFDLVEGNNSDTHNREFMADVSYDIYIKLPGDSGQLLSGDNWISWSGAENLGIDDRILLVSDGGELLADSGAVVDSLDPSAAQLLWQAGTDAAVMLGMDGQLQRGFAGTASTVDLWQGDAAHLVQNVYTAGLYLSELPLEVQHTQPL